MDNFMDKLAERYNAQEMIKANSQAEAAQMEGLQEQVEAYEAVLQEMRKLNYKNTELTEKMYSLVDESIEKVRTLQIEATESGAMGYISKISSEEKLLHCLEMVKRGQNYLEDEMKEVQIQLVDLIDGFTKQEKTNNDLITDYDYTGDICWTYRYGCTTLVKSGICKYTTI